MKVAFSLLEFILCIIILGLIFTSISKLFYQLNDNHDYLNYFELEINNQDFKILQKFIINNKGIIEKIIYNGNVVNLNLKIYKSLDELMYLSSLKIIKQEIVKNYVEVKNNG